MDGREGGTGDEDRGTEMREGEEIKCKRRYGKRDKQGDVWRGRKGGGVQG